MRNYCRAEFRSFNFTNALIWVVPSSVANSAFGMPMTHARRFIVAGALLIGAGILVVARGGF